MVELLPSILSADFAHLADEVAAAERGGGTVIHVDVMDGHFVPNITLGPPEACPHLHRTIELIHNHGMNAGVVLNPATRVDVLLDILPMLHHVLIMSVNPGFGGQKFIDFSLNKIRRLVELRKEMGLQFRIEVDGGVAHDTVAQVVQAGAELLVAGSAVFGNGNAEQNARELLIAARKAAGEWT